MRHPKIFYFGNLDRLTSPLYEAINSDFDVTLFSITIDDLRTIRKTPAPSVVLIELSEDNPESIRMIVLLQQLSKQLPIILLATNPTKSILIQAIRLGIHDIFMPSDPLEELISRIHQYTSLHSSRYTIFAKKISHFFKSVHRLFHPSSDLVYTGIPFPISVEKKPPSAPPNQLQINCFGNFYLEFTPKKSITIKSQKARALLVFLLYHNQKKIHKELIMRTFWGESSPTSAKNCLHVTICALRKHLAKQFTSKDFIQYKNHSYGINPYFKVTLDIKEFEENWKRGKFIEHHQGLAPAIEYYEKAYTLYQGDFLQQIHLDHWVEAERDHFREIYLIILDRLSLYYYTQEKYLFAIQLCQEALKKDACLEEIHRRLMRCYRKVGLRSKAIRQFHKCAQILEKELDIQPCPATFNLLKQIKSQPN